MAAKSKKRLPKNENKLLNLDNLQITDFLCSICQSLLVEPVTLPCLHDFCRGCFNSSIENNALCCPLCRLRIGSWLRSKTKQNNLVNLELWNYIRNKYQNELRIKLSGEQLNLPAETPVHRLSAPGEIKLEYEAELKKIAEERLKIEQKHLKESESLIRKIQEEEEDNLRKHHDRLKQDETLARQIQVENLQTSVPLLNHKKSLAKSTKLKSQFKIDCYLTKNQNIKEENSSFSKESNFNATNASKKQDSGELHSKNSPEMTPSYSKYLKNFLDTKIKTVTNFWNKENGDSFDKKDKEVQLLEKTSMDSNANKTIVKTKNVQSLPVSLPYTGLTHNHNNITSNKNRTIDNSSVDSMHQELCYFKPIDRTSPTSSKCSKTEPVRVPPVRARETSHLPIESPPTRSQYLQGLCQLRNLSLAQNLPSAFVIAINILRQTSGKCETATRSISKKTDLTNYLPVASLPHGKQNEPSKCKPINRLNGITKIGSKRTQRRAKSTDSITHTANETTPKKSKMKDRKASSERKPYLRSASKKSNSRKSSTSTLTDDPSYNNKVNLVVKNLSSPLENCNVKKLFEEQIRIEQLYEQEKSDFALACQVEAEWNGRRQVRQAPIKRQMSLNYALRPAKKLKI